MYKHTCALQNKAVSHIRAAARVRLRKTDCWPEHRMQAEGPILT